MRVCPLCSRRFDDGARFCPYDGTPVHALDPFVGTILDGKYRIDALLGTGAMGAVYGATQLNLNRAVAVKVIRNHILDDAIVAERFKREALTIARLKHPHIVAIYDFGLTVGAGAYIVMEYLEGFSLRQEIERRRQLPIPYAIEIMRQVCSAVHAAHVAGVIHRDLKPDNIFLTATHDGEVDVKVLDFGVAKLESSADAASRSLAMSGALVGTPVYMSPEVCENLMCDARSDVYSLGCVLYELITGQPPFIASSVPQLLLAHVSQRPAPPSHFAPDVPIAVEDATLRALAKRPADRFQTAIELGRAVAGNGIPSSPHIFAPFVNDTIPEGRAGAPVSTEIISVPTGGSGLLHDTVALPPTNIPLQMTSFVGRAAEVAEVRSLVSSARLLTLTGPGGMGETRLMLQVASELRDSYRDGVWVVGLASLVDPALVEQAIASALKVREEPGRLPIATLVEFLRERQMLLVLDNCEHVIEACAAAVGALLGACPELRVLASSQAPLNLAGELVYRLASLSLPEVADKGTGKLLEYDAVRLFVDRAKLAKSGFALTSSNAPIVASLCRKLDGIPLALELAAARVKVLSLEQILMRLDDRFRLLTGGDPTSMPRQQTLRATLDWSYALLPSDEKALLRRLSVFAGGCTLEATEAVCSEGGSRREEGGGSEPGHRESSDSEGRTLHPPPSTLHPPDVLDLLAPLVDKSLVVVEEHAEAVRYRMLETILQYGVEKLREAGEEKDSRSAHSRWCLRLAERTSGDQWTPEAGAKQSRIEAEHDNMRAALQWNTGPGRDPEAALRLCCTLGRFWEARGHWSEGRRWLELALAACDPCDADLRAKALHWAGWLAYCQGDLGQASGPLEQCLALRRGLGDTERVALTLIDLGNIAEDLTDFDRAEALYGEALRLFREIGVQFGIARALSGMGLAAMSRGQYDRSTEFYTDALAILRTQEHKPGVRIVLHQLGELAQRRGDFDRAASLLGESLKVGEEAADMRVTAHSLQVLSNVARGRGEYAEALMLAGRALVTFRELGDKRGIAFALESFACTAAAEGQARRALVLAGAAEALRGLMSLKPTPADREALGPYLDAARESLGSELSAEASGAGRDMQLERAIAYAFEGSAPPADSTGSSSRLPFA